MQALLAPAHSAAQRGLVQREAALSIGLSRSKASALQQIADRWGYG
jgi:hypothetical protein